MKKIFSLILCSVLILSGCQTHQEPSLFAQRQPRSILILPVVNNSLSVEAPLAVYSSLPVTLAEKGYYVFPAHTVKTVLEHEGLYEASEVQNYPAEKLASLFNADTMLYVTIENWDTTYVVFTSVTTVELTYEIKGSDGQSLWSAHKIMQYSPNNNSGSPLVMMIVAAIQRIAPNYIELVRQANNQVLNIEPQTCLPAGPYFKSNNSN